MDTVISLLVLFTLPQLVVPQGLSATSFRAVAEMVVGNSRIFSGESIRLRCSIPDDHRSTWSYLWFKESEQLPQRGEYLVLWKAHIKDSGKFYCKGVRDTAVGNIYTLLSLPVDISVDGGWAILQAPSHPSLVGDTLKVTCLVRATPELREVILYKDGIEVMRQDGHNPDFFLTNLTLKDQGMYSCRASWDIQRRTLSVISSDTPVQVLEVLSQPVLEIVTDSPIPVKKMKLVCHVQYNAPAPAPPRSYYFYKNGNLLGTAKSDNHDLVKRTPGWYSCKVKVPLLGLLRWSEPKSFGPVTEPRTRAPPIFVARGPKPTSPRPTDPTGPQTTKPPIHPTNPRPLAPSISSLPHPAAEPTTTWPSPHQSTETPTPIQSTEGSIQLSDPPLKPSIPATVHVSEESGDMSGGSADWPEDFGDMSMNSSDTIVW